MFCSVPYVNMCSVLFKDVTTSSVESPLSVFYAFISLFYYSPSLFTEFLFIQSHSHSLSLVI